MTLLKHSKVALQRLIFEFWSWRGQWPSVYFPMARWKHHREVNAIASRKGGEPDPDSSPPLVGPDTQLVVEGFPRSANSFAIAAIRRSEDRPLAIAHHQHVPAQIIAGAKSRIPTLVLIREPDAAVLSLVIRQPFVTLGQALRHYIRFYKRVRPFADRVLVVTFEEVTTDFGAVMSRLNRRFGSSFPEFRHTDENVQECFNDIERHERSIMKSRWEFDAMTARPSSRRQTLKEEQQRKLGSPRLARKRATAARLYKTLATSSGRASAMEPER